MKKILIIGGSGFIGTNICLQLSMKYSITVCSKYKHIFTPPFKNIRYIYGDWSYFLETKILENETFDTIILLSSSVHPRKATNIKHIWQYEIELIYKTFEKKIPNKPKIIYFSSAGGLYKSTKVPQKEDDPIFMQTSYSYVKNINESVLGLIANTYQYPTYLLRVSNPYGSHQNFKGKQGLIPILMYNIIKGNDIHVHGTGDSTKDYIYIDDLIFAIEKILKQPNEKLPNYKKILNIGYGKSSSINKIIETTLIIMKQTSTPNIYYHTDIADSYSSIDIKETSNYLNWQPNTDLDQGISYTYKWIKSNLNKI